MPRTDYLDPVNLAPLDAAPPTLIDQTMQIRSQARLEQILAMPVEAPASAPTAAFPRRCSSSRSWRWAAIPVAAAAALAASVMWPGSPALPPAHASLASWQAVPSALTGSEVGTIEAACEAAVEEMVSGSRWQSLSAMPRLDDPTILESRGDWVTVFYTTSDGGFTSCLVWMDPSHGPIAANGISRPFEEGGQWGSYLNEELGLSSSMWTTPGPGRTALAPDETRLVSANLQQLSDEGAISSVIGLVGADVERIVLHTYTGGDVEASVADGWYTAWWPGAWGGEGICARAVFEDGTTEEFGCDIAASMTLTLRDGSIVEAPFDNGQR